MKKNIAYLLLLFLISCKDPVYQPPRPTPIVTDTEMCKPAQLHLEELCAQESKVNAYCCRVVKPTLKGKTYTQFCEEKQSQGVFLNPRCVSNVSTCDQIDACTNSN